MSRRLTRGVRQQRAQTGGGGANAVKEAARDLTRILPGSYLAEALEPRRLLASVAGMAKRGRVCGTSLELVERRSTHGGRRRHD